MTTHTELHEMLDWIAENVDQYFTIANDESYSASEFAHMAKLKYDSLYTRQDLHNGYTISLDIEDREVATLFMTFWC